MLSFVSPLLGGTPQNVGFENTIKFGAFGGNTMRDQGTNLRARVHRGFTVAYQIALNGEESWCGNPQIFKV